jgi:hypothetical protein
LHLSWNRYFLPEGVALTYSFADFTEGNGFVETLLYAGPEWRAEVSVWHEYSRLRQRVETARGLDVDGDVSLPASWIDRFSAELLPAA